MSRPVAGVLGLALALALGCDDESQNVGEGDPVTGDGGAGEFDGGGQGCTPAANQGDNPPIVCGDCILDVSEECDDGNTVDGDGCSSTCRFEEDGGEGECGDGVVNRGEGCDDGNTADGDGCSAECQIEPPPEAECGNGRAEGDEACDDGNTEDGDGCSAECEVEDPECGNDRVEAGEQCDDGNTEDGDGCSADCAREGVCGNDELELGEECDDGNTDNGDGCDEDCRVEPGDAECGNGILEPGEQCDDGNTDGGDGCSEDCAREGECGNGTVEAGEGCDDGNNEDGDGCSAECEREPIDPECGNGLLEPGEFCDDGNNEAGDGCSPDCLPERDPVCGNGALEPGETCDDGNNEDGDGCDADCQIEPPEPECGNGALELGEQCDDGNNDDGDGCAADCTLEDLPVCGNGELEGAEECDDGNLDNGDGCDEACLIEVPAECGNGELEAGETCDDGNTDAGDGCDAECQLEGLPECGNGVQEAGEACDDGNLDDGDGCSADCQLEVLPECGNGEVEIGEECDDGNLDDGDGCSALCLDESACGNEVIEGDEECDDGNVDDGDGCDAECVVEAVDISAGGNFEGGYPAGSLDRYTFTIDDFTDVVLGTSADGAGTCGPGIDTIMELFRIEDDGTRTPVAVNDDSDRGFCSLIALELAPGDYEVIVRGFAGGDDEYVLDASFAAAPDAECGNGEREREEECDDGNLEDGDGCDGQCVSECGNGELNGAEECDDGNRDDGDGCDSSCVLEPVCGDGAINTADEECDDGNAEAGDGCDDTCQVEAVDVSPPGGDFDGSFQQDSFDEFTFTIDADTQVTATTSDGEGGCPADTILVLSSVDGEDREIIEFNDDIAEDNPCSSLSLDLPAGDYVFNVIGPQIDLDGDGLPDANAGVEAYVLTVSYGAVVCGNGELDEGEECDDGNLVEGDGCDAACTIEPFCGDGEVNADGEECDRGEAGGADCDAECVAIATDISPPGGDFEGSVQQGGLNRYTLTIVDPTVATFTTSDGEGGCPEGADTVIGLFQDDENGEAQQVGANDDIGGGNLCSSLTLELQPGDYELLVVGFNGSPVDAYTLTASYAAPLCGNGELDEGEACDDGNRAPGDGCAPDCTLEAACGNGQIDPDEECDDGNAEGGDGCAADCLDEATDVSPPGGDFQDGFAAGGANRFSFTLAEETQTALFTSDGEGGCPGDTILEVFSVDGDGNLESVARNDDRGGGVLCSAVDVLLPAGDYIVIVNGFGGDAIEAYVLTAAYGAQCGNGVVEGLEGCDDGNNEDGDGCSADCQPQAVCGNGELEPPEACDDGNLENGDGCDENCVIEPGCGNGQVDEGETCDAPEGCDENCQDIPDDVSPPGGDFPESVQADGADRFTLTVAEDTAFTATTSDGADGCPGDTIIEVYAADADGFPVGDFIFRNDDIGGGNVCSAVAGQLAAGDYVIVVVGFGGRAVDDYVLTVAYGAPPAVCGDGAIEDGEECDDGNLDPGDGCDDACVVEAVDISAGGDFVGGFPQNSLDRYTFTLVGANQVTLESSDGAGACPGDTRFFLFERVDGELVPVANNDDANGTQCSFLELILDAGEYELIVDGFNGAGIDPYTLSAAYVGLVCGNGIVTEGEQCDDGNLEPGDGCDENCQIEAACGNGIVDPGEQCDDGNAVNNDGCDTFCTFEEYDVLTGIAAFDGAIPAYETDVFRVTVDDQAILLLETNDGDAGCPGDTRITLYMVAEDGGRMQVAQQDGGAIGLCALMQLPALAAGNYEVEIDSPPGLDIEGYRLNVFHVVDVSGGGQRAGAIPAFGDDIFAFNAPEDTTVELATGDGAGDCPGDTVMTLISVDANGNQAEVAEDDDGGVDVCSALTANVAAGNYLVRVVGFNDGGVPPYVLTAAFPGECGDGDLNIGEGCDDGNLDNGDGCDDQCQPEAAGPVCGNGIVEAGEDCDDGNLENGDGCDALCTADQFEFLGGDLTIEDSLALGGAEVVSFTVNVDGSPFTAQTGVDGCDGDTVLTLFEIVDGARQEVIESDDDGDNGLCSLIDIELGAGDYELVLIDFGNNAAILNYDLVLSLRVPALGGEILITEVMPDPSTVADLAGEWFELHNPGGAAVNLDGWRFSDARLDADVFVVEGALIVPPGGYVVLGRNADPATNGGIPVDYAYGLAMALANQADTIIVQNPLGVVVDRVDYVRRVWPYANGVAMSLADPAADNGDPTNWCRATSVTANGTDLGTPGEANDACN